MKKINKLIIIMLGFLYFQCGFAMDNKNQLILTLINNSTHTLVFNHVSGQNPGNTFKVSPQKIIPGSRAIIVGETNAQYDLAGELHFLDVNGDDDILTIVDYRQFHVGQPIFSMMNQKLNSSVISKTPNPIIEPRALMYTAATVTVVDFSNQLF